MKAQFILINSKINPQDFLANSPSLAGELAFLGIEFAAQSLVAQNPQEILEPLMKATEENDIILLLCGSPMKEVSQVLAEALDLPLSAAPGQAYPVPKGAGILAGGEHSGFVLTEGKQAILCLPGEETALHGVLSQAAIPFLTLFYHPQAGTQNIPLGHEQEKYAQEYAAGFEEASSHVAVYDIFLRIISRKETREESARLTREIGEDFLAGLPAPLLEAELAPLLRDKLEVAKADSKASRKKTPWYQKIFPWKGDNKIDILRKVILLVCAVVFLGSMGYIGAYYWHSYINEKHYSSLETIYDDEVSKPDGYPAGYQNKFAGLYAINPHVAGWLSIEGTTISYPVVQYTDNDYYLRRDFYGNKMPHGVPYVDYVADLQEESSNTIIFGHNMKDGQMFAPLTQYQKLDFYKEHPVITFDSVYRDRDYKIISVFITNNLPAHGEIFPYHAFVEAENSLEMAQFLADLQVRSLIQTGVDVQPSDHLLTLSTCSYEFDDARFVVVARAVREGESSTVDVSKAKMNPAPLMPDIWYELYGGNKPDGTVVAPPVIPPAPPVTEPEQEGKPEETQTPVEETPAPETPEETPQPTPENPPIEETPQPTPQPTPEEQPPAEETPQEPPAQTPETPEPEPEQESPPNTEEIFRCACIGCNYISKHECTGNVDDCPCDCGVCQKKKTTYTSSVSTRKDEEEEEDEEDWEDEEVDFEDTLKVKVNGKAKSYDTYELICQIVQNEMGSGFHQEALKAQAVAAYSYIKYNNSQGISPSVLVKTSVSSDVKRAVKAVLGEGIYYNGKICNTTYYSTSAGVTNNAADVWGGNIPYLSSIEAEEDEHNKYYGVTVTISKKDMANYIEDYLGIDPEDYGDPDEWIEDIATFDNDMYVKSVRVAGKKITGRQFRENMLKSKINSHAFEVEYTGKAFEFTTYGYGHGVGMSQLGANYLAQDGWDYEEILEHYYTGVRVK